MICSIGGASVSSVGAVIRWGEGWVCGRGFSGCFFLDIFLGYFDEFFWGGQIDVNSDRQIDYTC